MSLLHSLKNFGTKKDDSLQAANQCGMYKTQMNERQNVAAACYLSAFDLNVE